MRGRLILGVALGLASLFIGTSVSADDPKPKKDNHAHNRAGKSALDPFKALAGDWVGQMEDSGQKIDCTVNYKVTSNGTAVVETLGPGTPHEMVGIIHEDGEGLALTHYCAIGNQPRMKTDAKPGPHKFAFKFTGASNLASDKDMHMHDVVFELVDKDTVRVVWTNYNEGKPAGTAVLALKRKK